MRLRQTGYRNGLVQVFGLVAGITAVNGPARHFLV